ncbi:hypothetical protein SKAU_G00372930 [Synaphobranchus kaupii]|uniref:Uncharacterized protein n=1 Tax=Synaphobranchus kaupii TaxID=118154 RepID=A0A9Q1IG02_SYNKA|nr:hypothetical protein SKAU_G00372930 [Synaphobranchus kaupii]
MSLMWVVNFFTFYMCSDYYYFLFLIFILGVFIFNFKKCVVHMKGIGASENIPGRVTTWAVFFFFFSLFFFFFFEQPHVENYFDKTKYRKNGHTVIQDLFFPSKQ